MKTERGRCYKCGQKTAARDGEAADGRPQYRCLNGSCEDTWTKGHRGEPWDSSGVVRGDSSGGVRSAYSGGVRGATQPTAKER